jgi:hypothetical protein
MRQLQTLLPSLEFVVIDGATHIGDRGAPGRPEIVASIRELIAEHPAAGRQPSLRRGFCPAIHNQAVAIIAI